MNFNTLALEMDEHIRIAVDARRFACGCSGWPKPCERCDAYEDAWFDASDWILEMGVE